MLECLILGDSLAVGVGQIRKECITYAKSGINSYDYVNRHVLHTNGNTQAKTVIISLGSNDYKSINTYEELRTLRHLVKADRVYWIMPAIKDVKRANVEKVAAHFNDVIIDSRKHELGKDGVHPTYNGYKSIANETRSIDR
jgi:lysophospholipase L1-like esterase